MSAHAHLSDEEIEQRINELDEERKRRKSETMVNQVINMMTDEENEVTGVEIQKAPPDTSMNGLTLYMKPNSGRTITVELNGGA